MRRIEIPSFDGLCNSDCPFYCSENWTCRGGFQEYGTDRPGPSCLGPGLYDLVPSDKLKALVEAAEQMLREIEYLVEEDTLPSGALDARYHPSTVALRAALATLKEIKP